MGFLKNPWDLCAFLNYRTDRHAAEPGRVIGQRQPFGQAEGNIVHHNGVDHFVPPVRALISRG